MKIVSQEVCTDVTSVSIIHTKEGALWPATIWYVLMFGFHNVENYSDSVLVVVSKFTYFNAEWLTWQYPDLCWLRNQLHDRFFCLKILQAGSPTSRSICLNRYVQVVLVLFVGRK